MFKNLIEFTDKFCSENYYENNYILLAQICIDEDFRRRRFSSIGNKTVFELLHESVHERLVKENGFDFGIAEIDETNIISNRSNSRYLEYIGYYNDANVKWNVYIKHYKKRAQ